MKISPRPDHPAAARLIRGDQPSPTGQTSPRVLYRGDLSSLFQTVPAAGTFGKDYGPDLAVWLAPRRLDPLRPARIPGARDFVFGRGSASAADLW
ncbi:MAG: hypothetical protein WAL37_21030, partial [Xanthobacteraceae bacterium]